MPEDLRSEFTGISLLFYLSLQVQAPQQLHRRFCLTLSDAVVLG